MIYKRKLIDYLFNQNLLICLLLILINSHTTFSITKEELKDLRDEVKELFYHGYDNYMKYAFPADELMPLSCRGRYRDSEPNRGDIDDVLGNFTLTLIDAMDTLVVMNNLTEFEKSVNNVIKYVQFDSDIVVSVFETNIRVVGGLLSGHVLADLIKNKYPKYLQNYNGELLNLAKDCALRLLPAFESNTGIPYPRVNLKYGMNSSKIQSVKDTCTACAGTIILEFGALSRLTNDTIFEQKARKAMDYLWKQRHRSSDLVGSILNINNGDWINRNSGVGAGIDSYYEYLLKAYILLGDESYLKRFNRHYQGIMKYISQGPLLVDVHMHKPRLNAKSHMDSLLAFWPGLQVLKGDLIPAIETHEILYQVSRMHNYLLPEAFSINDFQPYWAQFLIRPEFIESTYFLYEALKDDHYLEVGKQLLKSMKKYTMTPCGFAAVHDVRTGKQDDRMDSFVLSETLKYLYLLFTDKDDLIIDLNKFIFTTEAHFLPLSLSSIPDKARFSNGTLSSLNNLSNNEINLNDDQNKLLTCPNLNNLFKEQLERYNFQYFKNKSNKASISKPSINYYEQVRNNLKNYVESSNFEKIKYNNFNMQTFRDLNNNDNINSFNTNTKQELDDDDLDLNRPIRLEPQDFSTTNQEHLKILKSMGINIIQMNPNDPIQLVHLMSTADNLELGKEGIIFIKKMIKLSKKQTLTFGNFQTFVKFNLKSNQNLEVHLPCCNAQFGIKLNKDEKLKFSAQLSLVKPIKACRDNFAINNDLNGKFAIVERGECTFIDKVRNVERRGAIGAIIIDNQKDSSALSSPLFEMLGDGQGDVKIPVVLLYHKEAQLLLDALELDSNLIVHITNIVDIGEDKPMIKLINNLKEARKLIDMKLNKMANNDQQKESNKKTPFNNFNNHFQKISEHFGNMHDMIKEQVNELLTNNEKLLGKLQEIKESTLDKVMPHAKSNLNELMSTFDKIKNVASKTSMEEDLIGNTYKDLQSKFKDLKFSDMQFDKEKLVNLKNKLLNRKPISRRDICLNKSFIDYISTDYWTCI